VEDREHPANDESRYDNDEYQGSAIGDPFFDFGSL
jgi:hypothetical protein